jgi:hypothetical protein
MAAGTNEEREDVGDVHSRVHVHSMLYETNGVRKGFIRREGRDISCRTVRVAEELTSKGLCTHYSTGENNENKTGHNVGILEGIGEGDFRYLV